MICHINQKFVSNNFLLSEEGMKKSIGFRLFLLATGCVTFYFFFYHFMDIKREQGVDGKISSYMFSRIFVDDIKKFKDDSVIHGPIFFTLRVPSKIRFV